MKNREREKKSSPVGTVIGIVLALLMLEPEAWALLGALLVIGLIALPIWLVIRRRKHISAHQKQMKHTTFVPCEQEKAFDEKIQDLFCFHKDKATHHVARGREIDPWDRPDIDISKYQRK